MVSRYPSRSVQYNAVGSGPETAECTPWKWAWLANNCALVKCRLRVRAELSYSSILFDNTIMYRNGQKSLQDHGKVQQQAMKRVGRFLLFNPTLLLVEERKGGMRINNTSVMFRL